MQVTVNGTGGAGDADQRMGLPLTVGLGLGAIASVLAGASLWPLMRENVTIGVINLLVAVTFVATGLVLHDEPHQRSTGYALMLAALFYLISWWWSWPAEWQLGPLPLISYVFGYLWFVFGGLVVLRYPEPTLAHWWERAYIITMGSWVCGWKAILAIVSRPEWAEHAAGAWWPSLWPNKPLFEMGTSIVNIGLVTLAALLLVLLLLKIRRARGIDRVDSVPVVIAATAVAVCGSAYLMARFGKLSASTVDVLRAVIGIAALFTPLAFLTTALRRRLTRSSMADLIVRLAKSPTGYDVQQELRRSLPDPTLTLWFWLPSEKAFVDVNDEIVDSPPEDGRWLVPINTKGGDQLAALVLDPSLQRHPTLVAPAVAACGFSLENSRLHADLRAQLMEVRRSRMRIAQAELEERRRIERDLHDGAQQSLLAASASLGTARFKATPGSDVREAIEQAQVDLKTATNELRDLARGIHSPILTQSGLRPAIEGVVERLRLPTKLSITDERLPRNVETTAYYVVCETLANVAKHSRAKNVSVHIERYDSQVRITVVDDGCGGAQLTPGSGLAGIHDRVYALGGTMTVNSPHGGGTTVTVSLPCG